MGMELREEIEFPSEEQKEKSIAQIVSRGVARPRKLSATLWDVWSTAGIWGICFGIWDCMLAALLTDGLIWAAVYEAAKQNPQILGMLVFLASPVLYALLHLLTVWKEIMAGTYQTLMVCRLSLRQITVFRMILFGGISVMLSGIMNLWLGSGADSRITVFRLLSLSMLALFFYAGIQAVLEWKWKSRMACWAAPVLWSGVCLMLPVLANYQLKVLEEIPSAAFLVCAGACAGVYVRALRAYLFEEQRAAQAVNEN